MTDVVSGAVTALRALADPARGAPMAAYMRDQFPFLGVASRDRQLAGRELLTSSHGWGSDQLLDAAERLWALDEREFQQLGTDLLKRRADTLAPRDLDRLATLIITKSWWDTVDLLASHAVGSIVARHHDQANAIDRWIDDDNIWLARTAILHQLRFRDVTDRERLFRYVDRRAGDREFFIRKACGWALREYSKTDAAAVRHYVSTRGDRLPGLTRREALRLVS